MSFEYTVIPAPSRGEKAKDAKTATDRYALAVAKELNRMAKDGWEYIRADVLPSEERSGLTGRTTVYHNLLVFRREMTIAPVAQIEKKPQPEYPAAASPAQDPQPTPVLPDAAAPRPSDHKAPKSPHAHPQPETPALADSDDIQPPAPRAQPFKD